MDFVEAMEWLKRAVTDDEIAAATGVSTNTIRRNRADPATRNYRPAPSGWEAALARLAEERAGELMRLRAELLQAVRAEISDR
jgi:1,6-anhydro-N-acetylmuramate kinase